MFSFRNILNSTAPTPDIETSRLYRIRLARLLRPGALSLIGLLVLLFGPVLMINMATDADHWIINDDAVQQIPPFYRFESGDPALADDYVMTYYLDCFPLGYKALYSAAAWVTGDPRGLSKILPYLLLGALLVIAGMIAYRIGGWPLAFALLLIMLSSNVYLDRMVGGLPRAFGFVTVALVLLGLVARDWRIMLGAIVLGAAFYPATGFFSGICLGVYLCFEPVPFWRAKLRDLIQRSAILSAGAVAGLVLLLPVMQNSQQYGAVIQHTNVAEFPELGPGGRYNPEDRALTAQETAHHLWLMLNAKFTGPFTENLASPLFHPLVGGHGEKIAFTSPIDWILLLLCCLGLVGGYRLLKQLCLPYKMLIYALLAFVIALILSIFFAPYFYLPYRYIHYGWGILVLLLILGGISGLGGEGINSAAPVVKQWKQLLFAPPVLVVLAFLLLAGTLGPFPARYHLQEDADALKFLAAQPDDAMVAGWPQQLIEAVPYYSRRSALLTYETHQIFHRDFAMEMRERMALLIAAYVQGDTAALRDLQARYDVRYLLFRTPLLEQLGRLNSGEEGYEIPRYTYIVPFENKIDAAYAELSESGEESFAVLPRIVLANAHTVVYSDARNTIVDLNLLLQTFKDKNEG